MIETTLLLGCNLGDKEHNIIEAVALLEERVGKVVRSSEMRHYEAWGFDCDDTFVNQIVVCKTALTPEDLLFTLWDIERNYGRERGTPEEELAKYEARQRGERGYSSRMMDIDIIFYGEHKINTPLLTIPHPLYKEREFVLELLQEVKKVM